MEYITKDIDELQNMIDEARHDGCTDVNIDFEPSMYNLVDEDDRPELEDIDTDDLLDELERRKKEKMADIECNITDIAQKVIEKSPAAAREFFTDILGLTHMASDEDIIKKVKERI